MSFTNDLLDGLATALATAGVGTYSTAAYTSDQTGIGFGDIPEDCVRGVGITDYGNPDDSPDQPMTQVLVQVLTRGLPGDLLDANTLRDQVFLALHGMTHAQFGSCHVDQCLRKSVLPLGQDGNRRWGHASNFAIDTYLPPTTFRS